MTHTPTAELPRIVFFNINGNGMGHLSRCLAYARRLEGRARPVFFSLASAIEVINQFGFEADYFVSKFWSRAHINAWNRELVRRFGLFLEAVDPAVVVFDGTWPFHGFMDACDIYGVPRKVWSNRGLHKPDFETVPVPETAFDLVLVPGELGSELTIERERSPGRKVRVPPVTLLNSSELLSRTSARQELAFDHDSKYALLSLGPGNLKDVGDIGLGLIDALQERGIRPVWASAPISARDVSLPQGVESLAVYPLARYMKAFDLFIGAAGYNTCCEVIQSGVPTVLVPNLMVADDQTRRAEMVARHALVRISPCDEVEARRRAIAGALELAGSRVPDELAGSLALDGAEQAAGEIVRLLA